MYGLKVATNFIDKETKETHKVGQIIELPRERAIDAVGKKVAEIIEAKNFEWDHKTVVCINSFAPIGGIEQAMLNLVQTFPNRLLILTAAISGYWLEAISEYANIIVDPEHKRKIEADVVILTQFDSNIWLDNITGYKKVYQQVHADYGYYKGSFDAGKYLNDKRIDLLLPVSDNAKRGLSDVYGKDGITLANCQRVPQNARKKPLIGYFGRCTPEKNPEGLYSFIKAVNDSKHDAYFLISSNMRYAARNIWLKLKNTENVILIDSAPGAMVLMPKCDYLIQLSKGEASCEVVREALDNHVPVLVSRIPAFEYIKDGIHGWHTSGTPTKEELDNIFNKMPNITPKEWDRKTDMATWRKVLEGKL